MEATAGVLPLADPFRYPYAVTTKSKIVDVVAKILRAVLPISVFCWVSRATVLLQEKVAPKKWPYFSKVTENLYIGGMPLKNYGHAKKISDLGITAIVSLNQPHEYTSQIGTEPITITTWNEAISLPSVDLEPVKLKNLTVAVNFIGRQTLAGKKVLVPCNEGRGRSVQVVIASLIGRANKRLII